ncbi:MAG: hypothetical protein LBQ55_06815 [Treponema sp.]|nr:hypothetical protein [Treponema sp.]
MILALLFFIPSEGNAQNTGARDGAPAPRFAFLAGADGGLFGLDRGGNAAPLWQGGSVRKILRAGGAWLILGSGGIFRSEDLSVWENRGRGLPEKTLKVFEGGVKSFLTVVQEIKDLEVHPANPDIMVCATKDQVFLTRNGGRSWESLGAPRYRTNGIKAVAAADMPAAGGPELTVFLSHSTYGFFYLCPDTPGAQWSELSGGLEKLETTGNADEVSDIAVVPAAASPAGTTAIPAPAVYVSQTFRPRIYRLDWEARRFVPLWTDSVPFGTVDSLDPGVRGLRFVREGTITEIPYDAAPPELVRRDLTDLILNTAKKSGLTPNCVVISRAEAGRPRAEDIFLSELWLLRERAGAAGGANSAGTNGAGAARGREGLYLPVNHAMSQGSLSPYLEVIRERRLDMVVIDMKDDYGRLRFTPRNGELGKKGRVFRPLDIDAFLKDMKSRGIYTAARIVVFKDPELARREGGKYAVWDKSTGAPWAGYYDARRKKSEAPAEPPPRPELVKVLPDEDPAYEIVRTFYDETWVDPYSEEVWEYTAALAAELRDRGFDEIQFDYIRFPTDGVNMGNIRYRWQESGMDMESAIVSFLRHIRSRIRGPISIDIYGANGWYRTGARTGQEVEILSQYVDVICPMYYPSHFEQDFLAQAPAELRPYRIYYQGTQRTARIGRGKIIVRPYVQAFYLNVSYDRQYYNADYVRRQAEGVRDAGGAGLTYWNNMGRYDDIPIFPPRG